MITEIYLYTCFSLTYVVDAEEEMMMLNDTKAQCCIGGVDFVTLVIDIVYCINCFIERLAFIANFFIGVFLLP